MSVIPGVCGDPEMFKLDSRFRGNDTRNMPVNTKSIYAIYAARGIKLAEAEKRMEQPAASRKRNLLVYELGRDQYVFIYSFGAVVFTDTDLKNAYKILRKIHKAMTDPLEDDLMEEYAWTTEGIVADEVGFNGLKLKEVTFDKLALTAYVLAQSVAIDHFDALAESIVSSFDKINNELEQKGSLRIGTKKVLKIVGTGNSIRQMIISRLALLDKPEIVWEQAELENLYQNLRTMFELNDRFKNIEYKIQYLQNSSEIVLSLLRDRRAQALELIIIFLIAFEILLFLPDIFR